MKRALSSRVVPGNSSSSAASLRRREGATSSSSGTSANAFGERLRTLRLDRTINQRDLAAQASIDFTYLSKIENGRMPPPAADTIVRLAGALGVDPDELLLLARKVPGDIQPMLTRSPALPAFLRSIQDLSDDELRELSSLAQQVRDKRK
jgi:transcriptional regulator with XRE-family HTH domain